MKLAVIGVGLIGGSFALALKQAKKVSHVVGVGRGRANLELARERGIIDSMAADASGCDVVLIAAPVAQFGTIFSSLKNFSGLITDGGSTKRDVIAAARGALGRNLSRFVPAHPIAGGEQSGAAAAKADLFNGKRVIVTPLPENEEKAVAGVQDLWRACGAHVSRMSAEEHDAVLSTVSHLPHLVAYAMAHDVAKRENAARLFEIAGAGFRDFTRLASSHPEMWRDICIANRDLVLADMEAFSRKLAHLKKLLQENDAAGLEKLFAEAREARNRWIQSS
ncbi:MAG TPA: prephenate dehydrogenase/arogenate dehydrogenase family protein [Burkholderiales bacterium]|nr:prephenate dehydrogenase/arogenate dehydrogenase family protein [Burkholderiales bacterium]